MRPSSAAWAFLLTWTLLAGPRSRLVLPVPGGAPLAADVFAPAGQGQRNARRLCLLLHGGSGHASDFAEFGLDGLSDQTGTVFVCPEGGEDAFLATGPGEPGSAAVLLDLLLPEVARQFAQGARPAPWIVVGVSTGGLAALRLAFDHPDRFALAASLSGTVEAGAWTATDEACLPPRLKASLDRALGPPGSLRRQSWNAGTWLGNPKVHASPLPFIYLACGLDDPFLPSNQRVAWLLARNHLPHEYRQAPGQHEPAFWRIQMQAVLKSAGKGASDL